MPGSAFSLIEMTVAVALTGLGIVATIGIMGIAASSSAQSRTETHAALLANNLFDDLRRLQLVPDADPDDPDANSPHSLAIHPEFSLTLSSSSFPAFDLHYDATLAPVPASSPDSTYVATVEGTSPSPAPGSPTLVTITVSSPALALPEDRWRRTFASLFSFQR
jgi:Tfp pilus assembly protein PilV